MAIRGGTGAPAGVHESVRVEVRGDQTTLHLEGSVGVSHAKHLRQVALELAGEARKVHVRCEHLQHLDCAAVQVLIALNETLKSKGAGLVVQNVPDSVQQTLRVAGLASAF